MRHTLLLLSLLLAPALHAQSTDDDFQSFRQGLLSDYGKFRQGILDDYDHFLAGVWEEFEAFSGKKRDRKPKPATPPAPKPQAPTPTPKDLPAPSVTPQPEQPEQPKPSPTPAPVPPVRPTAAPTVNVSLYGTPLHVPAVTVPVVSAFEPEQLAEAWRTIDGDAATRNVLQSLRATSATYALGDWFTFELVRVYAERVGKSAASRLLLRLYLLTHLGYDVRAGKKSGEGVLLVPITQQVYARSFLTFDDEQKYYLFYDNEQGGQQAEGGGLYTYQLPQNDGSLRALNMAIGSAGLNLRTGEMHRFSVTDGKMTLAGKVDKGTMAAIDRFPQVDIPVFAMCTIDPSLRKSLLEQMRQQIIGLSERAAAQRILSFIQHAFDYATDDEQFGREKPFFVEENFFYPRNDCEDRAILYAFFVRHLLGLDVHLVHYPGHECTAVRFTDTSVTGDSYTYRGQRFIICDPTYIGASIGMCMPSFRSVEPEVELW